MFASYVSRNAFFAGHGPSYDVIGQILGGQSLEVFRGRKKDGRKAIEKMVTIERLTKKKYSRKTAGGIASTPPPPCAGEG